MDEPKALLQDIEKLRSNIYKLINDKGENYRDPEVIAASQILNAAITKYNEIIKKKMEE
jgi:hypothetical protein